VIVGGILAEEAVRSVKRAFADWSGSRPARSPLVDAPSLERPRIRRISLDEKAQANVVLGWPGPSRHHGDFIPCLVGNTILGLFGMYGRLGRSIREENGLAYYVYSKLSGGAGPGPWRVAGGFDPDHVDQGVELIRRELNRFIDSPVTEEELANTASYMTGSLPLHLETNAGVARSLISIERYGLGLDYLQNYTSMIQEVTSVEIQAAAQRWIDPDNYALAIAEPTREAS